MPIPSSRHISPRSLVAISFLWWHFCTIPSQAFFTNTYDGGLQSFPYAQRSNRESFSSLFVVTQSMPGRIRKGGTQHLAALRTRETQSDDTKVPAFHAKRKEPPVKNMNTNTDRNQQHWSTLLVDRRHLLQGTVAAAALIPVPHFSAVEARGLVKFPINNPDDLLNTYHFLRVGNTLLEEQDDIWTTNPLFF